VLNQPFKVIALSTGLSVMGCSGSDSGGGGFGVAGSTGAGGSTLTVGGATSTKVSSNLGGGLATGGTTATQWTATNPAVGGNVATGGAATGGVTATTSGVLATGGVVSAGGTKATGGVSTTGGVASTGGVVSTGGTKATSSTVTTGGSVTTGGTSPTLPKFVGNISTGNSVDNGSLKYSKYWDQITPENAGKWGSVQSSATSSFNWAPLDSIYSYAKTNSIIFKQHCFVWGSQQPSGTPTLAQVENWIKSFCTRYPETKVIDVVNEPPPHTTPNYTANLGAGETGSYPWITKAFKLARQYCPNAVLVLNDYNNIEWADNQTNFVKIVKDIKTAGAPIDAVGAQAHDLDNSGVTFATVQTLLAKLNTDTGLPVYITELDLSYADDTAQLNAFKQFMPILMNADYVKGITIWGWIYGSTWSQAPDSGLVKSGKSRPAMTYLMDLLGRTAP